MTNKEKISRTPFPNSKKVYIDGDIHPIKVAMRNHIGRYKMSNGRIEKIPNYYLRYFGTVHWSQYRNRHSQRIARIREQWILDRNDVEELSEISSDYGKQDYMTKKLNHLRLSIWTTALKKGANVPNCITLSKVSSPRNGIHRH
jgi:phosphomethylpyrimidine synthase